MDEHILINVGRKRLKKESHDLQCHYHKSSTLKKRPTCQLKPCRNNKKRENLEYYFITCIFSNIKFKSGFRISCSVRRKLFEESTSTAMTPNLLGISTFLGVLKSGGNLNDVTAMWRPTYLYLNFYR